MENVGVNPTGPATTIFTMVQRIWYSKGSKRDPCTKYILLHKSALTTLQLITTVNASIKICIDYMHTAGRKFKSCLCLRIE
jgi:hypothetical protein